LPEGQPCREPSKTSPIKSLGFRVRIPSVVEDLSLNWLGM
jgi:hypothetical protein